MSKTPVVYKSTHRIKFSELDPYNHLRTVVYAGYYVDHRMDGLREHAGWDLQTLAKLPFMSGSGEWRSIFYGLRRRSGDHHHIVRARVPWTRCAHRVPHG